MDAFVCDIAPARIVFGTGTMGQVRDECERLQLSRVFVVSTSAKRGEELARLLGPLCCGTFSGAVMHTPAEVTERALNLVRAQEADGLVAIGGGSAIGLSKAIALRAGLPQIAIPTTYAGSEMTPIVGETKDGVKTTQSTRKALPRTVILDVELTCTLPPALSAVSGMNAIAHAVEALYARNRNPLVSLLASEGIAVLSRALRAIADGSLDAGARSDALYGACLCGICLGSVEMALHHKLCHTLGGTFNLPHAETHTVMLPHVVAYNAPVAPNAMDEVARAIGADDAACGLYDLVRSLRVPRSLEEIGMPAQGLGRAADLAAAKPYWNPRPVERPAIYDLLGKAFAGLRPTPFINSREGMLDARL